MRQFAGIIRRQGIGNGRQQLRCLHQRTLETAQCGADQFSLIGIVPPARDARPGYARCCTACPCRNTGIALHPPGQPVLGVLMLDTNFPRPVGDIGNPESFDHPVIYRRLPGAVVSRIVTDEPLPDDLVELFVGHARALEDAGATVISTSCGFLFPLQDRLQAAVGVPVVTSALCMLPASREKMGAGAPIGILTFDAERLSPHHIPDDGPVVIEGLATSDHLYRVIADDLAELDQNQACNNVADAMLRLKSREPDLTAVILECTNLPPYRSNILKNNVFPIYDIHDTIKHLQNNYKM